MYWYVLRITSKSSKSRILGFSRFFPSPENEGSCPLKINGWFRCMSYWNSPFLGDEFVRFQSLPWMWPPSQDASHHQDYEPFLVGNPNLNLHFPLLLWGGHTQGLPVVFCSAPAVWTTWRGQDSQAPTPRWHFSLGLGFTPTNQPTNQPQQQQQQEEEEEEETCGTRASSNKSNLGSSKSAICLARWLGSTYLGTSPLSLDSSYHQDDMTFVVGNPNLNLHFASVTWWQVDPNHTLYYRNAPCITFYLCRFIIHQPECSFLFNLMLPFQLSLVNHRNLVVVQLLNGILVRPFGAKQHLPYTSKALPKTQKIFPKAPKKRHQKSN